MSTRSLAQYEDVKVVLDQALNHRGGRYRLSTYNEAVHWRQRAYKFRQLLRDRRLEASITPGFDPGTPYEKLSLYIPKKGEPDDHIVVITFLEPKGVFEPNEPGRNAEPVDDVIIVDEPVVLDPEIQEQIDALAEKLAK